MGREKGRKTEETVAVSEFKAKCLAILRRVQETGRVVVVSRRGERIAEIHPPTPVAQPDWLGSMADRGRIVGDLIEPVAEGEWEVLHE